MYQAPNGHDAGPQPLPEQLSDNNVPEADRDDQVTVVEGEDSDGTPVDDQVVSLEVRSEKIGFLKDTETEGSCSQPAPCRLLPVHLSSSPWFVICPGYHGILLVHFLGWERLKRCVSLFERLSWSEGRRDGRDRPVLKFSEWDCVDRRDGEDQSIQLSAEAAGESSHVGVPSYGSGVCEEVDNYEEQERKLLLSNSWWAALHSERLCEGASATDAESGKVWRWDLYAMGLMMFMLSTYMNP
jgi:hypothetical protein